MESLSDTIWDVVICGTGLQQSLLALALSRSNKNILHIDPNQYYGGSEAALSVAEADAWAAARPEASAARPTAAIDGAVQLGPLSAYSVALAPQFLHARSTLVELLVSSRAFRQLEFLAVSSFFVLESSSSSSSSSGPANPSLARIPATREDVFASTAMPARAKRQLMKFLKFVLAFDGTDTGDDKGDGDSAWQSHASEPLGAFLQTSFGLDDRLRDNVLALTLSLDGAAVTVAHGLARLHRHITSMGLFGPGFAAVYPKWGGCGEIVQVACRAAAVGGGIYMLGSGIKSVSVTAPVEGDTQQDQLLELELTRDMTVKTKLLVRGSEAIGGPSSEDVPASTSKQSGQHLSRLIAVIGAPLPFLFAPTVEGAPVAGGAVIALPAGRPVLADGAASEHPVFVMAHSSDTGECPVGQSVLHFTTIRTEGSKAVLESALTTLLVAFAKETSSDAEGRANDESPSIPVLYSLYYEQPRGEEARAPDAEPEPEPQPEPETPLGVFRFPPLPVDLMVQDAPLEVVREAWRRVMGPEEDDAAYMAFVDREGNDADDMEYD
ncbi:Rab geranylgeranyl transferase escort protein [Sporothrix schenckii 1099-18]|uniref:Rab proteins geranylgeranyltransferase n=1 Tax=Sporothrix schenckii 1099-18 TaxID=1397361 RepID=A0A0F2M1Z3_SPOSC|nr:Rab geranylgeranyl transferase escort protein [Sporothrix schenckii 1099-18]KJR82780.1 Rab geranylgeranyl transferase escort protein [Sporothrix schenckii 1099-18]